MTWEQATWVARQWKQATWKQASEPTTWNSEGEESQPGGWPQWQARSPQQEEDNVSNSSNGSLNGSEGTLTRGRHPQGKTISASTVHDDPNLQANADPMNEDNGASTDERQGLKLASPPPTKEDTEEAFETYAEALEKEGKTCGDTLLGKDGDGPAPGPKAPPPNATPPQPQDQDLQPKVEFKAPPPHISNLPQPDQDGQHLPTAAPPVGPPGKPSPLPANQVHTCKEAEAVWAAGVRDGGVWKNLPDEERSKLMQAGSLTMRHGLEKLHQKRSR